MSQWNSPYRRLLLLLAFGMSSLGVVGAQEIAILRFGPDPARGIPYLRANALGGFRGAYMVGPLDFQPGSRGQAPPGGSASEGQPPEPEVAEVFYTREPLVLPREWSRRRCGNLSLLVVEGQEDFTLCYRDEQGWTLFFQYLGPRESSEPTRAALSPSAQALPATLPAALPGSLTEPPPWACPFAESFVRRFQILLGFVDASREPPFPAILQLGR